MDLCMACAYTRTAKYGAYLTRHGRVVVHVPELAEEGVHAVLLSLNDKLGHHHCIVGSLPHCNTPVAVSAACYSSSKFYRYRRRAMLCSILSYLPGTLVHMLQFLAHTCIQDNCAETLQCVSTVICWYHDCVSTPSMLHEAVYLQHLLIY